MFALRVMGSATAYVAELSRNPHDDKERTTLDKPRQEYRYVSTNSDMGYLKTDLQIFN
jgi:hypothetical protein